MESRLEKRHMPFHQKMPRQHQHRDDRFYERHHPMEDRGGR